ncbi:hypothetical protein PsYK624_081480 [Phanerochaete sordida]|uniref:Uncharacterized protein n=1 Tax=Phanerochaete sordida TaxID=48140 RepID=A0A9P3GDW2_9APHY|nr:hypothetical protein PsYK624_081480 [Phanerochaete sordida]
MELSLHRHPGRQHEGQRRHRRPAVRLLGPGVGRAHAVQRGAPRGRRRGDDDVRRERARGRRGGRAGPPQHRRRPQAGLPQGRVRRGPEDRLQGDGRPHCDACRRMGGVREEPQ